MSQYMTYRCSSMEEYAEKQAEYKLATEEARVLRAQGVVVHLDIEIPLPPEGYPDEVTFVAKGIYQ